MLEDAHIKENEAAHFSCEVYPDEVPMKWYINHKQIKPNDKYHMPIKGPQRHLLINGVAKADEGRVSARIGDDLQSSADLHVEGTLTYIPRIK